MTKKPDLELEARIAAEKKNENYPCSRCRRFYGDIYEGILCRGKKYDFPQMTRTFDGDHLVACSHQLIHLCESCNYINCKNRASRDPKGVTFLKSENSSKSIGQKIIIIKCPNYSNERIPLRPANPYEQLSSNSTPSIGNKKVRHMYDE